MVLDIFIAGVLVSLNETNKIYVVQLVKQSRSHLPQHLYDVLL